MDPDSMQTVLWMVVLLAASAFFTVAQTAFSVCNISRLKSMAEEGNRGAVRALRLSENLERLLAAILVCDTISNILFTVLAVKLFSSFHRGALIATAVTVVAVLFFGETAPRGIARLHAESCAVAVTPLLRVVLTVLYPLTRLFSLWAGLLQAVFKPRGIQPVTEEDLLTIVEEAEQEGSLDEQESDLFRRVIAFNDREAEDILIPRVDVVGLPTDATAEEMAAVFAETGFSRLPVYEETMDHILGVVHHKNFTTHAAENPTPAAIMAPAVFIPPTMKIRLLLKKLQEEQSHIAIVSDEYGGTLGIVTMEDILEELVGDIWDEHDDVIENIRPLGDGSFSVLCSTELEELMAYFDRETDCESTTVSGWVMEALERIPAVGDSFTADGLQATVRQVDKSHPEEILLRPIEKASEEEEKE
ncbi:MAG: HlyC/CorC family transporter [Clostridia bacterium]|nr:HlyC/CorC family transporter [Clostridia bacterium]